MRNTALIVAAVFAALVVLAVAVPTLIDWSRYKGQIVARAESATGRPVTISGPIGLRLLPSPAISAKGLAVGNPPGTEGQLATAESLRLRLALLPLLVGRVEITSLELDRPVLRLARLPDGSPNWQLDKAEQPSETAAPHRATKAEPPPLPEDSKDVPVEQITIHQGSISYAGDKGAPVSLDAIDANLSIGGRSGPFLAKGDAKLAGTDIAFDAAMDRMAPGRASPATLTLNLPGSDSKLEFSGLVTRLSGGETLRGRLTANVADLGRTLARLGVNAAMPAGAALAADSELTASAEEIAATNLVVSLGDTRATGAITAALGQSPQVDVRLTVASLDLDKWQAPAKPAAPAKAAEQPSASASAPAPAAPSQTGGFALPRSPFVSAALSVDTLSWRGQVARDVQLEAVLDQGEVMVHKAAALLPGGSAASMEGALTAENGQPVFDGKAQLRSDNLRALLAWAQVDPPSVPESRLRALDFTSPVRLAWPDLQLSDFRLTLDGAQARGALTAHLADRMAFGLDASIDSLNVDFYSGSNAKPAAEAKPAQAPTDKAAAKTETTAAPNALASFDANVKLAVRRLILNDVTAETVALDGMLQAGQLTLNQLSAGNIGGAQAKIQGRVLGLAENAPRVDKLAFQVNSPQPARLLRFLGVKPPALTERLGTLAANGTATGDADHLTVDARAETGGLELTTRGAVTPRADITVQARHASTAQLIRILSPDYRPKGTIGAFALDAKVTGDGKAVDVSGLTLTAGPARLTGQGRVDMTGAKPQITVDLSGNALALDPFLAAERTGMLLPGGPRLPPNSAPTPTMAIPAAVGAGPSPFSTEPLDLSALQGFDARIGLKAENIAAKGWRLDQPVAQLAVLNGTASMERLTGKLLGGDMTATAKLSSGATPALSGQVSILGADVGAAKPGAGGISVTKGRLDAETRFTTSGRSSQDMAARLNGDGKLLVRDGIIDGFDLPAVNQRLNNLDNVGSLLGVAQAGLSGGQTPFSQLYGTFRSENGIITSRDLKLEAQGGAATVETTNDLPRWTTNTRIAFTLANAPQTPLGVRLEGPLDNPRKIIDVNALQQYLVSRGLGRALKGKGGETLQGLFGKTDQPPPAPGEAQQSEQPREKNTGKAILKDLLKGLGGR